jgi:hypothetical protein
LKPIHKLIMLSAVYTQDIGTDAKRSAVDPEDRLLWRRAPRRLEGEAIRDAMLAVSGTLDKTMYGAGTLDTKMRRRSIYFSVKRSQLVPAIALFDGPDGLQGVEQRSTTTVAPQALLLLNNSAVRGYAETFAKRIGGGERPVAESVKEGYLRALGRMPSPSEMSDATEFLRGQTTAYEKDGKPKAASLALEDFCQALLSLNEFVYID